jgi:hypothetical protein
MLSDFGAKSVDQRRPYFVSVQSAFRASYSRFVAGSVPAPNPRDHRTPQVTDYERNASHYQFHGSARQVGKSVKKSDDCR